MLHMYKVFLVVSVICDMPEWDVPVVIVSVMCDMPEWDVPVLVVLVPFTVVCPTCCLFNYTHTGDSLVCVIHDIIICGLHLLPLVAPLSLWLLILHCCLTLFLNLDNLPMNSEIDLWHLTVFAGHTYISIVHWMVGLYYFGYIVNEGI